jgi:2-dehydropantoate 2-reductase
MRIAIVGSGAVGGYFGARLAHTGQHVTFIARGAHLAAIRESGLRVRSPKLGDFTVQAPAEEDTAKVGPVDLALFSVKAYDNETALPLLKPLIGPDTVVLTLQNGVDSVDEVAAVVGQDHVLGGTTYVATALEEPGLIVQTGVHRSIIFGEVFADRGRITPRVQAIADIMAPADIQVTPVPDGRVPIWDKFVYLAPFSGFTGAARLPIGPIWQFPHVREMFYAAAREVAALAKAEGVEISANRWDTLRDYMANIPPTTRSSLLIDLEMGKRIEVEALQGAAVRRGARHGVDMPIIGTLYAALKPWARGPASKSA